MDKRHNIRALLGVDDPYVHYCREERNFAAVLYHLLLDDACLARFLALIDEDNVDASDVRVYFEYACLRDLWAVASKRGEHDRAAHNARLREAIISLLGDATFLPGIDVDCEAFNRFFVGDRPRAASKTDIQMPSRWSDRRFSAWEAKGRNFAELACALKWAFNAKPDLVLDLGCDRIVCIEAKLESPEGKYSAVGATTFTMRQMELQQRIFQNLLGYDGAKFVLVSNAKKASPKGWKKLSWQAVYGAVLLTDTRSTRSATVQAFTSPKVEA
ncbi:hypothetical protein DSC_11915 [Pseudoxanthomonas spadix BD-a59]|uniref:Uncharacterized protein n=1 Tax=Pseudoxanthomonas spadix (strain BD-a59) TaxID=1045855 RepID=G7UQV5_PSEUP|nr:hypothetical protein [Pseudoxanthomonas spadix]AER57027.1 hypothetical protein DSC_11915 [Pseudoxanthomonas spadix BD-a59]